MLKNCQAGKDLIEVEEVELEPSLVTVVWDVWQPALSTYLKSWFG